MKTLFLSLIAIAFLFTHSIGQTLFEEYPGWYHFSPSSSDIPDYKIGSLAVDDNGALWVGSNQSGGLARYRNGIWKVWHVDNSPLTNNAVGQLIAENHLMGYSNIWMIPASGASVIRKHDDGWVKYSESNSNITGRVSLMKLGADGKLWVLTQEGMLQFFMPETDNWSDPITIPYGYPEPDIFTVDHHGKIWFYRYQSPLYVYDLSLDSVYNMTDSIQGLNGRSYSLMEAKADSIFISSYGKRNNTYNQDKKFWFYDGNSWQMYARNNSEISGFPYRMDIANGSLWFACDWGVSKYDGQSFTNWDAFNSPLPLDDKTMTDIVIDHDNRMWVSTSLMGLYMLDLNEWSVNSVREMTENSTTAYPNPAKGIINISLPKSIDNGELRVFDGFGKLVLTQTVSNSDKLSFELNETGLFHYCILNDDAQLYNGKVVNLMK